MRRNGRFRFGELFAGVGGLSLGLERAGLECAFHAEIEEFPRRVLKHRWPNVPLYGDVTKLDGRKLVEECGPIDLLSGGSPCQDLSVAGKRAGMTEGSGTRSSLFHEQVRIWRETGAEYFLWENVDGARSSNEGRDFAAVLSTLVGGAVAVPGDGWRSAGVAVGPAGIAAWRILDAQFFGVPQRRRRVFVLCSRTGRVDPAAVLLEREGVRRDSPKGRETREGTAPGSGASVEGESGVGAVCLRVSGDFDNPTFVVDDKAFLAANPMSDRQMTVFAFHPTQDPISDAERSPALGGTTGGMGVLAVPLLEVGKRTGASTDDPRAGIGIGADGDPMFTLQAGAQHGVVAGFTVGPHGGEFSDIAATLDARCKDGPVRNQIGTGVIASRIASTLDAAFATKWGLEDQHVNAGCPNFPLQGGIPRRLTPLECERLMGWPDNFTNVPDERGKPASDSARYKACGNGVVSHCAEWIARRLIEEAA